MISEFHGKYRFLSNFWYASVVLDGVMYPTVEHAFQAAKTLDLAERKRVHACTSPSDAKRAGRTVTLRDDWEDVKVGVMHNLVWQKFQRPDLKNLLVDTGDQHLEEGNHWNDRFWGVCPPGSGQGQNQLGIILMDVRRALVSRDFDAWATDNNKHFVEI